MTGNDEITCKNMGLTFWERFDAMTDEEIDTSEIPPLDEDFFDQATLRLPHPQTTVPLKLDTDVLEWFRSQGQAYQRRMNMVLRFYMESHKQRIG